MSIFNWVAIRNDAETPFEIAWTAIKGFFTADVEPALKTFLNVLETNGGSKLLALALQVVTEAATGVQFGQLVTDLIAAAKATGIEVTEIAAQSALQVAKTNIAAQIAAPAAVPATETPATGA